MNREKEYLVSGCFHCGAAPTMYLEKFIITIECRRHPEILVQSCLGVAINGNQDLRSSEFDQKRLRNELNHLIQMWDLGVDVWCSTNYNRHLESRGSHFIICHKQNPNKNWRDESDKGSDEGLVSSS